MLYSKFLYMCIKGHRNNYHVVLTVFLLRILKNKYTCSWGRLLEVEMIFKHVTQVRSLKK